MRSNPSSSPDSRFKNMASPFDWPLTSTNGHQNPCKIAHHMMQERIGPHIDHDKLTVLKQFQVVHCFDGRLGLTLPRPERAEVMRTNERLGRLSHQVNIERAMVPSDLLSHVGRSNLIVVDDIAVATCHSTEAGVEMSRHFLCPSNTDVARQVHIRAHDPCMHIAVYWRIEVHHLPARMHQSVGAPGATQSNWIPARNLAKSPLQGLLYRRHSGTLALETTIPRTFVFDA